MIDFNRGEEKLNKFTGSERKTTILYENEIYLIKLPDPIRDVKNTLSYMNNQFSEHIGCCIIRACNLNAQETVLGFLTDINGKSKVVVGCKDFTQDGSTLYEFSKLAHQVLVDGALDATIENVYNAIKRSKLIPDKTSIINGFWDMFVLDALLGNPDRHFDNWGVLEKEGKITFAPVYDCGSSLGALLDDRKMDRLLQDGTAFKNQEFNVTSCYSMQGKRIFYHEIFKRPPKDLVNAIQRTIPGIDMESVSDIVNSVSSISDTRKNYLIRAIGLRYREILVPALRR